ncbi:hypothetical protein, partial [Algoriphagus aquaeductus]|uniref:hypothetical protein n=2 Tax=Algoriphagus TaxID=246875 RepID=UPI001C65F165
TLHPETYNQEIYSTAICSLRDSDQDLPDTNRDTVPSYTNSLNSFSPFRIKWCKLRENSEFQA